MAPKTKRRGMTIESAGAQEAWAETCGDEVASSATSLAGVILVEVRTLGGALVARLATAAGDTVGALKQRVLSGADPLYHQGCGRPRLVLGCAPLADSRRLGEFLGIASPMADGALVLNLVCPGPSSLAAHIEYLEHGGSELSGITDVADAVFQAEYAMSLRCQPQAADVTLALPRDTRAQVVAWLGMACEATLVDDTLLHGAVLTLDRYAASFGERVDEMRLLKLSLAALCTEMKLTNEDDFPTGHWQRVLLHLSQGRELLPKVLEAEAEMLRRLRFIVGVPTPLTFLNGLSLRLAVAPHFGVQRRLEDGRPGPETAGAALWQGLARMLTELALYDAELEYRHPPAVLAAGALGAALLTVGPEAASGAPVPVKGAGTDMADDAEPRVTAETEAATIEELHQTLIEDLSSYCPGIIGLEVMLRDAELDLLIFWRECTRTNGRLAECYSHLRQRHARSSRLSEALEDEDDAARGATALLALSPEVGLERYFVLHSLPAPMDLERQVVDV